MLAIGNGAQKEILDQIEIVGAKNIVIVPNDEGNIEDISTTEKENTKYSPSLTNKDVKSIDELINSVEKISPVVTYKTSIIADGKRKNIKLSGVSIDYFSIYNLSPLRGRFFSNIQEKNGASVCVIGANLASKLFTSSKAIGNYVKCGSLRLKVIGVVKSKFEISESLQKIGMNNYNDEVFIPIQTALLRFKNRSKITESSFTEDEKNEKQLPQLDKIIAQINNTNKITSSVDVLYRMLLRKHNTVEDFKIIVPEQILQQKKKTDDIFNILLGVIAGISLLVGGIGIMNIMLASVLERIKEIGLRLSVGAKKKDIKQQFILESLFISIGGGIVGVILGIILAYLSEIITGNLILISFSSVIISFIVSAGVGVIFGFIPAKRAAEQNPVNSLRQN